MQGNFITIHPKYSKYQSGHIYLAVHIFSLDIWHNFTDPHLLLLHA